MTRLAIDGGGYRSAVGSFVRGNELAADLHTSLRTALVGHGPMAGDDSTSVDFAHGYDDAAAEALGAVGEVVGAFASLAVLTQRSLSLHRAAEDASRLGQPLQGPGLPGGAPTVVTAPATSLPTCLGGEIDGQPDLWHLVVDHLEGLAWPGADTAELRRAATTWSTAADQLRLLPAWAQAGAAHLEQQRAPEVPLALDAVADLDHGAESVADVCDDLAHSCRAYADEVEAHRAAVRGILHDLAVEIALSAAAGAVGALFTAGASTAAAAALATTRGVVAARRVVTALRGLTDAARARAGVPLASAAGRARPVRADLARLSEAHHVDDAVALRQVDDVAQDLADWRHLPRLKEYTWDVVLDYKKDGPMTPMEHIKKGHWPDSTVPAKGRFHDGITEELLRDYIEEAVRRGTIDPEDAGTINCDLGRVIGTDTQAKPTSILRVHIRHGSIRSAFPADSMP